LLDGLAGACEGGELHIDVPAENTGFIAALEVAGFAPTFTTTRMYKGPAPKLGLQQLFGVTTLELG
jgi:hypothetical protein